MKSKILWASLGFISLCFGCESNAPLIKTMEQQQQTINEMQAKLGKLESEVTQIRRDMGGIKKDQADVKEDVKKAQPGYVAPQPEQEVK